MSMNPPPPPHSGHRGLYFAPPRRRAVSTASSQLGYRFPRSHGEPFYVNVKTMEQYPCFPPPIAVPQHLDISSKRNPPRGPILQQRLPFQLSQLNDVEKFKHAVANDPQGMFAQLTELVLQNHDLNTQVTRSSEILESAHKDFESRRKSYDKLIELGYMKQLVLWKHIERLQGGLYDGAGLKGAKERFERRELERKREQEGMVRGRRSVKSPKKELQLLGNESPGTVASVLSDMISEEGFGSPVRSLAGSTSTSFDPTADIFIPGRFPTPLKYHSERSNAPANLAYPPPHTGQISNDQITAFRSRIPSQLINVCPISMTHEYFCPRPSCRHVKLCGKYNDLTGSCSDANCPFLHEYRTCSEQLLGRDCSFTAMEKTNKLRKSHKNKRVHGGEGEDEELWHVRTMMAALIPAHLDGRY